jgi:hypothetical protein
MSGLDKHPDMHKAKKRFPLWSSVEVKGQKGTWEVVGFGVRFDGVCLVMLQPAGTIFDMGAQHLGVPWNEAIPI